MALTPFKYQEYDLKVEASKNDISNVGIHEMKVSGRLDPEDIEILQLLMTYKYLNTKAIETHFQYSRRPEFALSTNAVKNRMKKLNKNGMVVRYYLQHLQPNENQIYGRTPYFYALTRGSFEFIKKHMKVKVKANDYFVLPNATELLRKLVINQLVINFDLKSAGVTKYEMDIPLKARSYHKDFHLMSRFYVESEQTDKVYAESVRREPNWTIELKTRLDMIYDHIRHMKYTGTTIPLIILVGEDDDHLVEMQRQVVNSSPLGDLIYYTTDTSLLEDNLSGSLFEVKLLGGDNYDLIELNADFLDKKKNKEVFIQLDD